MERRYWLAERGHSVQVVPSVAGISLFTPAMFSADSLMDRALYQESQLGWIDSLAKRGMSITKRPLHRSIYLEKGRAQSPIWVIYLESTSKAARSVISSKRQSGRADTPSEPIPQSWAYWHRARIILRAANPTNSAKNQIVCSMKHSKKRF